MVLAAGQDPSLTGGARGRNDQEGAVGGATWRESGRNSVTIVFFPFDLLLRFPGP